ncbi:nifU-like protein 1, chloroplastic [Salvia miltiorrhiza]|uniref:nifU-like protein 1, chloroplastic n=1 Tax=Salvia miltiorrhiza TaxID=226208 RepID=UPI0025AD77B8|nr:nifU-like protein 1, chloroplastic [Salvia miltiorrhiza]
MASMATATATARTTFTTAALISSPKSSKIESIGFQSIQPLNIRRLKQNHRGFNVVKASASGLYSAEHLELTAENVDKVLDNVRPYLITDGGNVDVVSVENGVVSLKLQGACESCPSSTTTMKMGIERVLKEKFGDEIKDICQVYDEQVTETTVEAVNNHLEILRPAIKNYGGSVEVLSVVGGDCVVRYIGPDSIGSGIKAAIKERFPDIANVQLTN